MKKDVKDILRLMDEKYGTDLVCYLDHDNAWQLLFATILSAQCTDKRVNEVTKTLYRDYPDLKSFAGASYGEMEEAVRSTGFYKNKARALVDCARILLSKYDGQVPSDIDELTKLPGVGRKTANVIRGNIFGIPSIVVDTHVKRVSRRLGLTKEEDPVKIEFDLYKVIPKDHWILVNLQFIAHGRQICDARKPLCEACFLREYCSFYKGKATNINQKKKPQAKADGRLKQ
jgi:endonuclease-3